MTNLILPERVYCDFMFTETRGRRARANVFPRGDRMHPVSFYERLRALGEKCLCQSRAPLSTRDLMQFFSCFWNAL